MGWIAGIGALAGGVMSYMGSKNASKSMQYRPWNSNMPGVGSVQMQNGMISYRPDMQLQNATNPLMYGALDQYAQGQQNALGQDFLRNEYNAANTGAAGGLMGLLGASGLPNSFFGNGDQFQQQAGMAQGIGNQALMQGFGGYGGQNFLNAGQNMLQQGYTPQGFDQLRGNMLSNFNPNEAASNYTNLLRQQAMPAEQQATASALTGLFGSGRLGTTGGANQMSGLAAAQQQADIGRQVAGQQYGLQQQLMAQQGLDSALNAEQGRQLGAFNANQMGMMNQYGMASQLANSGAGLFGQAYNNAGLGMGLGQSADAFGFDRMMGLNQAGWDRANSLYTASNTATQDRFNRAMQLFGGENALNQQYLSNFTGLLGAQQSQQQTLMDQARIAASVGQAQTAAGANAAMMRNQGNQDLIAGFMAAADAYRNKDK